MRHGGDPCRCVLLPCSSYLSLGTFLLLARPFLACSTSVEQSPQGILVWLKCSSRVLHGVVGASEDYSALQSGKTEYKSVTVAEDSTAEEFMDFYLDDDTRATWVSCSPSPVHLNSALYLCLCSAHWAKPRAAAYISQPCFHNLLSEGHSTCITMRFLTTSSDCDSR